MIRPLVTPLSLVGVMLLGASLTATAAPPAPRASDQAAGLQAQLKQLGGKLTAARTRHAALQSQVAQMEQQNAAQQKQLQQRDAEIATLQQKLRSAGAPAAPASSAGH